MLEALESRVLLSVTMNDGVLTINGTPGNDAIFVVRTVLEEMGEQYLYVLEGNGTVGGLVRMADVQQIRINGGAGNDWLEMDRISIPATITGGAGNDVIFGGTAADRLTGGKGDDYLIGRGGNDTLAGRDGADALWGNGGNDELYARGGGTDAVDGGKGNDLADIDVADDLMRNVDRRWIDGEGRPIDPSVGAVPQAAFPAMPQPAVYFRGTVSTEDYFKMLRGSDGNIQPGGYGVGILDNNDGPTGLWLTGLSAYQPYR